MSVTSAPPRPTDKPASNSFQSVLWAEWTKFRTVRGWIVALVLAAAATFFLCYETAAGPHTGGCSGLPAGAICTGAPQTVVPTGPGGEGVADTYEFVHGTLTSDGTVTAEITSLAGVTATNASNVEGSPSASHPGLASWAKAGLLLTKSTTQGSAYAAVMATGSHGIHFQYNYTHDTSGTAGTVTTSTPRWLRLVLYLILIGLLSLGVATAIRDTAASVGAVLGLLYLPPIAAQLVNDPTWRRHLEQIAPMTAGLAIQATTNLRSQPIAQWAGLGVLAAWAVVALLSAGLFLRMRDA